MQIFCMQVGQMWCLMNIMVILMCIVFIVAKASFYKMPLISFETWWLQGEVSQKLSLQMLLGQLWCWIINTDPVFIGQRYHSNTLLSDSAHIGLEDEHYGGAFFSYFSADAADLHFHLRGRLEGQALLLYVIYYLM